MTDASNPDYGNKLAAKASADKDPKASAVGRMAATLMAYEQALASAYAAGLVMLQQHEKWLQTAKPANLDAIEARGQAGATFGALGEAMDKAIRLHDTLKAMAIDKNFPMIDNAATARGSGSGRGR
jgi:hypothetical protein